MPHPSPGPREPVSRPMIDATFRNGSLTAISVILGFSLTFLTRWSALPGSWSWLDLVSVGLISSGILLQIIAVAVLLFPGSLRPTLYTRSIVVCLTGLAIVAIGISVAIVGDIVRTGSIRVPSGTDHFTD